jgi:hypothetical protein
MNHRMNRPSAPRILAGIVLVSGLALAARAGPALADPSTASPACSGHPHRGGVACPPGHEPPPEAFSACSGKASGDACSVSMHGSDVAGTCVTMPGDSRLVCMPKNHPPPKG